MTRKQRGTSETADQLSAADAVRAYKGLAETERVFRGMKGVNNHVRPIGHRLDPRVRAHVFISMLAYYLEWHLRDALKPLLFDDEARRAVHAVRDPVAPAQPSPTRMKRCACATIRPWRRCRPKCTGGLVIDSNQKLKLCEIPVAQDVCA